MDPCLDDALKLDYLNGTLSEGERALFEEHLAACPECRREIADLRRTTGAVAELTLPPVPAAWSAAAKGRLRAESPFRDGAIPPLPQPARPRTNVLQYAAIAAGVAGGLAILFWLVLGGAARSWLPDLSATLGISGPRAVRTVGLVTWILSLQSLLLVPSIIDNVYRISRRGGRRSRKASSSLRFVP